MSKQKTESDKLILVTELNRKFCITLGRKMYVYKVEANKFTELNNFYIRPALKEGWLEYDDKKCYITKDEDRVEYAQSFDEIITHFIKKQMLYINPDDKLIKFKQSSKKK